MGARAGCGGCRADRRAGHSPAHAVLVGGSRRVPLSETAAGRSRGGAGGVCRVAGGVGGGNGMDAGVAKAFRAAAVVVFEHVRHRLGAGAWRDSDDRVFQRRPFSSPAGKDMGRRALGRGTHIFAVPFSLPVAGVHHSGLPVAPATGLGGGAGGGWNAAGGGHAEHVHGGEARRVAAGGFARVWDALARPAQGSV